MKKFKIQHGSVQETLVIPLYARKLAMDLYPENFTDHDCQELFERIEIELPKQHKIMDRVEAIMAATRQVDFACICKEYLTKHPRACVVNLGCGLDTTFRQIDNSLAKGCNIDLLDVIKVRNELLPQTDREKNIAADLKNVSWFEQIDYKEEDGAVFFAAGVFYYFKKEEVKQLLIKMAERFPGCKLAFDATNERGLKNMLKTWLEPSEMGNINVYFSLEDKSELMKWSDNFSDVRQKGYMTGYRPLDKRYGWILNRIFKYLDESKMCRILEIEFKSRPE